MTLATEELPPLALYVHVPWCARKCPYCDFNSHSMHGPVPEAAYVDALLQDLDRELESVSGRSVHSVFIGGGTPSVLTPRSIDRLLSGVQQRLQLRPGAEITLEANPGSSDASRFGGFADAGVTRLSLGVQSFDDSLLRRIGRIHDGAAALAAVAAAQASGISRVNLDLMFALPGQSIAQARADLVKAVSLGVEHLSYYQLTLEPNTEFHRNPPSLPGESLAFTMQCEGIELLESAGYERYEVSAYARGGGHCQHNLNYWRFGDYLGIGAGAHGKITRGVAPSVTRSVKQRHPRRYMRLVGGAAVDLRRIEVAKADLPFEFMLNALRLLEGVESDLFEARTGLALRAVATVIDDAERDGLMQRTPARIAATHLGQRFLDDLVARFLPAASSVPRNRSAYS